MRRFIFLAGTTVVSAAAGAAIGYFISKKRFEATFDQRVDEEIAIAKALMNAAAKAELIQRIPGAQLPDVPEKNVPTPFVNDDRTLNRLVTGLRYKEEPTLSVERNVFLNRHNEDIDEDEEVAWGDEVTARTSDKPYIISIDEHMEGVDGYSQVTLTYFVEDDTLIDEGEVPIEDANMVVGEINLDRFGYRSGDSRVVYVRNDRLKADYEILRHEGSFGEVVHGQIAPRVKPRPRKMRKE
jgi:hypothetical protein